MLHLIRLCLIFTVSLATIGASASAQELPANEEIQAVFDRVSEAHSDSEKLIEISGYFLGRPYGTVCGDGPDAKFEQGPLSCFSTLDCVTYVEAVLALYFMNPEGGLEEYLETLADIKYSDSNDICYANRNHFVSLDWMPNQIEKGYLKDITTEIQPKEYSVRRVLISKKKWYEAKKIEGDKKLSKELQQLGSDTEDVLAELPYIAIDDLLTQEIQDKLPDFAVFNMVRGDHRKVHIPVVVGHQGFLVRLEDGSIAMRQASSKNGIVEVSLNDYLNMVKTWRTWPILGFNIAAIQ